VIHCEVDALAGQRNATRGKPGPVERPCSSVAMTSWVVAVRLNGVSGFFLFRARCEGVDIVLSRCLAKIFKMRRVLFRQRPSRPLRCLGILASTPQWTLNAGTHFFRRLFKSKFFASSKSAASSLQFDNFSQDILLSHLLLPQSSEGFLSVSAIQASHLSRETCQWDLRTRVTVSLRSSRPQVLLVFHLSATTSPLSHLVGSYDHLLSQHLISGF
jgi:hypothetical protein